MQAFKSAIASISPALASVFGAPKRKTSLAAGFLLTNSGLIESAEGRSEFWQMARSQGATVSVVGAQFIDGSRLVTDFDSGKIVAKTPRDPAGKKLAATSASRAT